MAPPPAWTVVIPVKMLDSAKSRLSGVPVGQRELALAFFEDTLSAASGAARVAEVVVATADATVRERARTAGALVVDDTNHPGINAAAQWAAQNRSAAGGVAVVVSDLPSLTAAALDEALTAADAFSTAFLADLEGTGTTMWFARPGAQVSTHFGPGSRAAHVAAGDADLATLAGDTVDRLAPARCDVDTDDALERARSLGLGHMTRTVLARVHH